MHAKSYLITRTPDPSKHSTFRHHRDTKSTDPVSNPLPALTIPLLVVVMVVAALLILARLSVALLLLLLMTTVFHGVLGLGAQECTGQGADNTVAHLVAAVETGCTACHGAHEAALTLLSRGYVGIGVWVGVVGTWLCVVGSRLAVLLFWWVLTVLVLWLLLVVVLWCLTVWWLLRVVVVVRLLLGVLEATVLRCTIVLTWTAIAGLLLATVAAVAFLSSVALLLWCSVSFLRSSVSPLRGAVASLLSVAAVWWALVPRV